MKKKALTLILCVVMVLALAACGGSGDASGGESAANGRTDIILANTAVVTDLDPANWYLSTQSTIFDNVYSTLIDVTADENGNVVVRGDLAKSWEPSEDLLTWTFHLNENAVYSNGDKVTAAHVKECFDRCAANPYTSWNVDMIASSEAPDENTFVVHMINPSHSAPACWYMVAIYNPELYDADHDGYVAAPVASGAYNLTAADTATGEFTLEKKEDWWGEQQPAIQTVTIKTVSDPSTLTAAIEKGEVDFGILSGTNAVIAEKSESLVMKEMIAFTGTQLVFNLNNETMQDKALRQAVGYALNYDALHNAIAANKISVRDSTLRFAAPDYDIPDSIPQYTYDPEKAKQILADANIQTPVSLGSLIGGSTNGSAELVKQNLHEVGIEVEIQNMDNNAMAQAMMGKTFDIGITTSSGYLSAGETLQRLYGTGELYNFSCYSNPELDKLAVEAQSTSDEAEYEAKVTEALTILAEDTPVIGMGMGASYCVGNKDLFFVPSWSSLDLIQAHWN